jgi:hypothetical protein
VHSFLDQRQVIRRDQVTPDDRRDKRFDCGAPWEHALPRH